MNASILKCMSVCVLCFSSIRQLSIGRLSVHLDTEEGMEKGLLQDVDMSHSADCLGTGWLKAAFVTQTLVH